jgi:hypothetical protein
MFPSIVRKSIDVFKTRAAIAQLRLKNAGNAQSHVSRETATAAYFDQSRRSAMKARNGALVFDRFTKAASAATLFLSEGGLLMRCVSFLLMILAAAATSSVRGQQSDAPEALRDAARAAAIEERAPARDARRDGRQERRDERQEARGDRGDNHELLRLALIAALRDGDFGDRQSVREERRDDRQAGREERRDDRGGDHELLRLAALAALRDGDFGDRQSVREERRDDRQEGREERWDDRRESRGDRD